MSNAASDHSAGNAFAQCEQWLQQNAKPPQQICLGLSRLRRVQARMQLTLPMPLVTVAGTNGKGSVCHLLSAILTAAGFRVGCYTSPHLLSFGERVKICDAQTDAAAFLHALKTVAAAARADSVRLTYFELTTLAAAHVFAAAACEVVILEVGLGGRLDAVNIFDAEVAVVTSIGLDHTEYLGDTRDLIAREKAGICRRGKKVVIGDSDPPPGLLAAVRERGALPLFIGREFSCTRARYWHYHGLHRRLANLPPPALAGAHQRQNAAVALAALECLPADFWGGAGAVRQGLHAVSLPGRAQVLPAAAGAPTVVLDVAHNAAAAAALEQQLFDMGYYPQTLAVLGMLKRKDIGGFAQALQRRIDGWYVAMPQGGDLPAADIAAAVKSAVKNSGAAVKTYATVAQAAAAARADCREGGRIVITGSFLTVADYLQNTSHG